MAPLSGEQVGGESTSGDSQRSLPTPFLSKTYQLVDDASIDHVISWNGDGTSFIVWNTTEFARDVLPKFFKHNNFSSFVRQLNTYGFRKVVPDRWEFSNDCFRKGEKRLLRDIQRRKISTSPSPSAVLTQPITVAVPVGIPISPSNSGEEQVISSNSSPVATAPNLCVEASCSGRAELVDENERLRRENLHLNRELTQMKSLCDNIYALMSSTYSGGNNTSSRSRQLESVIPVAKPLDLLLGKRFPGENDDGGCWMKVAAMERETIPKLFGVPIGVKRARGEESEGVTAEHDSFLRLQQPGSDYVKSEMLDRDRSDDQETSWLKQCHRANQRVCN